jgi:cytochrome P450
MFMSLMSPEGIQQLTDMTSDQWRAYIEKWEAMDQVVLHEEAQEILCRAVCNWAGIPLTESEARQRTCEFGAMIDGAGAVGPRNWRGNMAALAHGAMFQDIKGASASSPYPKPVRLTSSLGTGIWMESCSIQR